MVTHHLHALSAVSQDRTLPFDFSKGRSFHFPLFFLEQGNIVSLCSKGMENCFFIIKIRTEELTAGQHDPGFNFNIWFSTLYDSVPLLFLWIFPLLGFSHICYYLKLWSWLWIIFVLFPPLPSKLLQNFCKSFVEKPRISCASELAGWTWRTARELIVAKNIADSLCCIAETNTTL